MRRSASHSTHPQSTLTQPDTQTGSGGLSLPTSARSFGSAGASKQRKGDSHSRVRLGVGAAAPPRPSDASHPLGCGCLQRCSSTAAELLGGEADSTLQALAEDWGVSDVDSDSHRCYAAAMVIDSAPALCPSSASAVRGGARG